MWVCVREGHRESMQMGVRGGGVHVTFTNDVITSLQVPIKTD